MERDLSTHNLEETTPLIPSSSSPSLSSSTSPPPPSSSSSKYLFFCSFLLHVVSFSLLFFSYSLFNQKILIQSQDLINLHESYLILQHDSLQNEIKLREISNETISTMRFNRDIEDRLVKLEGMTSNSDVIDELHETEAAIYNELQSEKTLLSIMMNTIQTNVTRSLTQSNRLVDKKLSDVDHKIKISESKMYNLVEETSRNVTASVEMAERHIQVIDGNLTSQMTTMTNSVGIAINSVRMMVEDAKEDINTEVTAVHDSMNQYIIFSNNQFAAENDFVKYQLAGTFSLLACLICLWHITSHSRHIKNPEVQKRIMAILWMVPIYSVTSWLSLVVPTAQPFLGAFRDGYEAYVVYTFIAFLKAALGTDEDGNERDVVKLLAKRVKLPDARTPFPISNDPDVTETVPNQLIIDRCVSPNDVEKGHSESDEDHNHPLQAPCPCCIPSSERHDASAVASQTLDQCALMAMQFVFIKPLLAAVPFFLELSGYDYEGHSPISNNTIDWFSARLYILLIGNLSVSIAFYGLLCFFHITEKDLLWCKPWPKFLCVKGVVFMTFWQDLILQCMSGSGMVDAHAASQIQNLLICVEMFMASIAHFFIFPYEEWDPKKRRQQQIEVRDTMAFYAFLSDFKQVIWKKKHAAATPGQNSTDLELKDDRNEMNESEGVEMLEKELQNLLKQAAESYTSTPHKERSHSLSQSQSQSQSLEPVHFNSYQNPDTILFPTSLSQQFSLPCAAPDSSPLGRNGLTENDDEEVEDPEEIRSVPSDNETQFSPNSSPTQGQEGETLERERRKRPSPNVILHGSDEESDSDQSQIQSV